MISESGRRMLWLALSGLVIGILGVGWDRVWHQHHAESTLTGATEVLEAHWLMLLGVAVMFLALAAAVRLVRQPRSAVWSTWAAFIGSLSMVVGFGWDSVRHIQGHRITGGACADLCWPRRGHRRNSRLAHSEPKFRSGF